MKRALFAAVVAGIATVAISGCGNDETVEQQNSSSAESRADQQVSPLFGANPCETIESAEVAAALGTDGIQPERTFTDNTSDGCEWSGPDGGQLTLGFLETEQPEVPPDPDSARLTEALGRQAIVLRSGPTSCNVSVGFSKNRWFLFAVEAPEGERTPADPAAATGCDQDLALLKTIGGRLDWG